jgi:indoleamine 2,3-dioxygenase
MTRPIPLLSDYGMSSSRGFLPPEPPLRVLPDPYYAEWEAIVADLPSLVVTKKLRQAIDRLPVLSTDRLKTPAEWRRANVCLTFMLHAYVFGEKAPRGVRHINSFFCLFPEIELTSMDTKRGYLLHSWFHC